MTKTNLQLLTSFLKIGDMLSVKECDFFHSCSWLPPLLIYGHSRCKGKSASWC